MTQWQPHPLILLLDSSIALPLVRQYSHIMSLAGWPLDMQLRSCPIYTLPTTAHYVDAKRLFRYLHQMRTYVLVYWRPKPLDALPYVPFPHLRPLDEVDRQMHMPSSIGVMCGYLDYTHVNCLYTRRNDGANVFFLAGTAITYRAKCIAAICLSSTECVFITSKKLKCSFILLSFRSPSANWKPMNSTSIMRLSS
jgi:hypothetical protein